MMSCPFDKDITAMHLQSTLHWSIFLPSKRLAYAQQCMFLLIHIKDEITPQLTSYFHMMQVLNLEFRKKTFRSIAYIHIIT